MTKHCRDGLANPGEDVVVKVILEATLHNHVRVGNDRSTHLKSCAELCTGTQWEQGIAEQHLANIRKNAINVNIPSHTPITSTHQVGKAKEAEHAVPPPVYVVLALDNLRQQAMHTR